MPALRGSERHDANGEGAGAEGASARAGGMMQLPSGVSGA